MALSNLLNQYPPVLSVKQLQPIRGSKGQYQMVPTKNSKSDGFGITQSCGDGKGVAGVEGGFGGTQGYASAGGKYGHSQGHQQAENTDNLFYNNDLFFVFLGISSPSF